MILFHPKDTKGYTLQIEMVYRTFLKGLKIIEYPIVFEGRRNKKSKMSFGIVLEAGDLYDKAKRVRK